MFPPRQPRMDPSFKLLLIWEPVSSEFDNAFKRASALRPSQVDSIRNLHYESRYMDNPQPSIVSAPMPARQNLRQDFCLDRQ